MLINLMGRILPSCCTLDISYNFVSCTLIKLKERKYTNGKQDMKRCPTLTVIKEMLIKQCDARTHLL